MGSHALYVNRRACLPPLGRSLVRAGAIVKIPCCVQSERHVEGGLVCWKKAFFWSAGGRWMLLLPPPSLYPLTWCRDKMKKKKKIVKKKGFFFCAESVTFENASSCLGILFCLDMSPFILNVRTQFN